ncbi:adenosylhomocysteinase [Diaminobutyricibacter sp. McL0618]|uniref:adenosylhomocysteinase n=1 Tax=Leifsonia sp. McL0618 TaxID=3415677 RepID=UPI003CED2DD0
MFEPVSGSPEAWAATIVRQFAEATNLSIAGKRFAVRGSGMRATALTRLLAAIGARLAERGESVDYLFCTGEDTAPLDRDELEVLITASAGPQDTLLIVDATADASAVGADVALHEPLRHGVWATDAPLAVVVRVADSAGRQHHLGPAAARIAWARRFMPTAAGLAAQLTDAHTVRGLRVGVSMVLEPKTAVLALLLQEAGAEVTVFAHPDETDDEVAAALRREGIPVYARSGAGPAEHRELAVGFLAARPQVLVDDGSHVIRLAHETGYDFSDLIGAAEETTSGLRPLRLMADDGLLRIPVVAVNDARSKTLFDNRYGTGQSCVFAILGLTGLEPAGRRVVVAGYGHVGQGVAHHVRALGGTVVVAEVDPVRALAAVFDGYRVAPLIDAVATADLVISATGVRDTISLAVLRACTRDAVVAVAGGVPQEVAIDDAVAAGAVREAIGHATERFTFPSGQSILILDDGGCINVTAGEGNPIEIMDLSFAVQLSAIRFLVESAGTLQVGVHPLPPEADGAVAAAALEARGVRADASIPRQAEENTWLSSRFDEEAS